jgi:hypothetical protein
MPRKSRLRASSEGDEDFEDGDEDREEAGEDSGLIEVDTSEKDAVATIEAGHVEDGFDDTHAAEENAEENGEKATSVAVAVAVRVASRAVAPSRPMNCAPSAWRCAAATRSRT